MSYKKDMQELTKSTLAALNKANADIADLKAKEKEYDRSTYSRLLADREAKRDAVIHCGKEKAELYLWRYKQALHKEFALDPDKVPATARLLDGSFELSAAELEEMLDNHKDNRTMQRMVWDYASKKNMSLNRPHMQTEAEALEIAEGLQGAFRSACQRPEYGDTWTNDSYFASISKGMPDL